MSDNIWVSHVSDDAFTSRHASFPMTKTGSKKKNRKQKKKPEAKKYWKRKGHSQRHRFQIARGVVVVVFFLFVFFPILSCARVKYEAHCVR